MYFQLFIFNYLFSIIYFVAFLGFSFFICLTFSTHKPTQIQLRTKLSNGLPMSNATDTEIASMHATLTSIAGYSHLTRADYTATRQGGLTNRVYKIDLADQSLILRLPGTGTEEYIDRKIEAHNARQAEIAGVSAKILFTDPASGVMLSRCIPNIETMSAALFGSREGSPARAGRALKKLHSSDVRFVFRFELFDKIDEYIDVLSGKDIDMPEGYHDVVRQAQPVKTALENSPVPLTPCHCDPLCENFLDDGQLMWIVDWEYSGMNDPYWDLGDLSVEGEFDDAQDRELMRAWCGQKPSDAEMARMKVYKAMCDLLWTLWGLIQHADGNPADDFWAYATGRFERCKALMSSAAFPNYVNTL